MCWTGIKEFNSSGSSKHKRSFELFGSKHKPEHGKDTVFHLILWPLLKKNARKWFPLQPQLIEAQGYPVESHYIITEDGYILNVFRIPNPNSTNGVVFLQHGLLSSSDAWLLNYPTKNLREIKMSLKKFILYFKLTNPFGFLFQPTFLLIWATTFGLEILEEICILVIIRL